MIKMALIALIVCAGFSTHAATEIWMNNDRTVITVEGNAFDWDAINLYDSLNVVENYSHIDGLSVGMKDLKYTSSEGLTVLHIFCAEANGGIDAAHCFITLERSLLTWFDQSSQQAVFTISNPQEARRWAKSFRGMDSRGRIYGSYDGRLNIFATFENGVMSSVQLRYIP